MIEQPPKIKEKNYLSAFKILNNSEYLNIIREINDKYLYWDKVKYQRFADKYTAEDCWAAIKLSRLSDFKILQFGNHKFKFSNTDYIQKILHDFDLNVGGTLGSQKLIQSEDKDRYLISSIMEEAIASSQMEGAVTTRKKAKDMLRKNDKPQSKSEQMIVNNYKTIQHIVNIKHERLTPEKLSEIHKLISYKTLDAEQYEGCFRDSNDVYIVDHINSEVVHTPPDYKEINTFVAEICDFFNNEEKYNFFIHPILKGIIIHFLIGYLHPFVDGNGRTARALFYWYMLSKEYWLTEYLSISRLIIKSKNQYEKAYLYTEHDENDLTYFITYNLKTMNLAYEALRQYIQRKIEAKKYITKFQFIDGINERQSEILKLFYDEQSLVLNVKEVENRFRVSNQTARTDLFQLVEKGFLTKIKANNKKQLFIRSNQFSNILFTPSSI